MIGPFYREGYSYNTKAIAVYDHDWQSLAEGVAVPHGLYDLRQNKGYIQIGTSKDTTEFACDSIHYWWIQHGQFDYPVGVAVDNAGNVLHYPLFDEVCIIGFDDCGNNVPDRSSNP